MMDRNLPCAWLRDLELHANADMAYINGRFEDKSASKFKEEEIIDFVNRILPFAARSLEIFSGSYPGSATCGRIIVDIHPSFDAFEFDVPVMGLKCEMLEWNAIDVEVWIRSHLIRTINLGFLTVAVRPAQIPAGEELDYHPPIKNDEVIARLSALRPVLSKCLGTIGAMCLNDNEGELILEEPRWDEFVYDATEGYELRGVLR